MEAAEADTGQVLGFDLRVDDTQVRHGLNTTGCTGIHFRLWATERSMFRLLHIFVIQEQTKPRRKQVNYYQKTKYVKCEDYSFYNSYLFSVDIFKHINVISPSDEFLHHMKLFLFKLVCIYIYS